MKRLIKIISIFVLIFVLFSCSENNKEAITIIYTNDVHGYIANSKKDDANNEVSLLRLNNISGYTKKLKKDNKNVLLVDAGDEIQGSVYGSIDKGVEMIEIFNKTGYDLATPGNHDFDFGMDGFNRIVNSASYKFISCNFKSLETNKNVLDSYKIYEFGGTKIGFIGISTPETITSSTPTFFKNSNGDFIYTFDGVKNKNELYSSVQASINEIRDKVDYLIGLGHLGVGDDEKAMGWSSIDLISNTYGLDAFIAGHSHTLIEKEVIKTKDNKDCILTQTGCYLNGFGQMNISKDGLVETKIINSVNESDDEVKQLEDSLITKVNNELGSKIGVLEKPLYITDSTNLNQRLVRSRETNLGDFVSDSVYWYLNEAKELDCDIVLTNGGGIRNNLMNGDLTYLSVKTVSPFGNQLCLIKTKGINIKNALEMGVDVIEGWDSDNDCPAENGGFMQVAGMKYVADASISSYVSKDDNGMFKGVEGDYRVTDILVYNKKTNSYEELDENKEYLVGGTNYILKNNGNGLTMFSDSETILDYISEDYMALAEFMKSFKNENNECIINNSTSPFKRYINYSCDYENPKGSGRITLLNI